MVKHIVFWKLQPEHRQDGSAAQMKQKLEALVGVVPGLLSAEVHAGFSGWDVALLTSLESREALEGYQNHPAHVAVKQYVHSVVCERTFCDFEF